MAAQARRDDKRVGRQRLPVLECTHHGLKSCQNFPIGKLQQDQGSTTGIYASGNRDFAQSSTFLSTLMSDYSILFRYCPV